jgi:3,5-epimerase/4-reductase
MKLLIYGSKGWIGKQVIDYIDTIGIEYVEGIERATHAEQLISEIDKVQPTHIMSFIGRTHGNPGDKDYTTIDYLQHQDRFMENIRDNLYSPIALAIICNNKGIHFTYLGTGCLFNYDDNHPFGDETTGFLENDLPNFFGSNYSTTKGYTDQLMHLFNNTLNLRIRMCLTPEPSWRNFITKLVTYEKICSIPNSMSVLPDLIPIMVDMAVNKITGTVNLTNPGLITHNEILEMYREIVDPHFTWRNMTLDEQTLVLSAGRSNNYLDHKRLVELYPNVKHIKEAVRECLEKYPKPEKTIKIVIARYHEDISWVLPYKEHVIIYNKGHELNEPFPPQIFLPNVGRETHTYYHHIVENYNRLDDFTIFLQGHPFDHAHNCIEKIDDYLHKFKTMNLEFEYISQSILTTSLHGCPYHHGLPMRDVYNNIFGPHKNPNSDIVFGAGALFIVSKQSILRRPKQFYENIVSLLDKIHDPIETWVIERFHRIIFTEEEAVDNF